MAEKSKDGKSYERKGPINPATVEGRSQPDGRPIQVTFSRLYVRENGIKIGHHRTTGSPNKKELFQILLWRNNPLDPENPEMVGMVHLEEAAFLDMIGHLFPQGELSEVHLDKKKRGPVGPNGFQLLAKLERESLPPNESSSPN